MKRKRGLNYRRLRIKCNYAFRSYIYNDDWTGRVETHVNCRWILQEQYEISDPHFRFIGHWCDYADGDLVGWSGLDFDSYPTAYQSRMLCKELGADYV